MDYQLYQGIQLPFCTIPSWPFRHHQHFPASRQLQHSPSSWYSCTNSLQPWPCQGSWTPNLFSREVAVPQSHRTEGTIVFSENMLARADATCMVGKQKQKPTTLKKKPNENKQMKTPKQQKKERYKQDWRLSETAEN